MQLRHAKAATLFDSEVEQLVVSSKLSFNFNHVNRRLT